ncbi:MAG: hypothetical protein SFY70_02990 [Bacteroidia bacterium]|nr:hypothetical protein [Bacteroidia bacterium]
MKRVLKRLLVILGAVLGVVVAFLVGVYFLAKPAPEQLLVWETGRAPSPLYNPADFGPLQLDSLRRLYGKNKVLPPQYELQCLLAIAHYPSLQNANVSFVLGPAIYPLASRPEPLTLLGGCSGRRYNVFLSTDTGNDFLNQINVDKLPFNACVAIIAHELGHAAYYQKRSGIEMLAFPLHFFTSLDYRAAHESTTDKRVLYQGLGLHMLEYTQYTRRVLSADGPIAPPPGFADQMGWVEKLYLDEAEVRAELATLPAYAELMGPTAPPATTGPAQ